MPEVYFTEKLSDLYAYLKTFLSKHFRAGETIAVKLHMGERGNKYYLKPPMIKPIVDILREIGTKPFLFDSLTLYRIARHTVPYYLRTAAEHGYTEEKIGCPIKVSNESIPFESNNLKIGVCRDLIEADGVLVLSHVKTHLCAGLVQHSKI